MNIGANLFQITIILLIFLLLGQIVQELGFVALNISVAVLSILYVPMLYYLKDMHDYQAYEEEEPGTYNSLKKNKKFIII